MNYRSTQSNYSAVRICLVTGLFAVLFTGCARTDNDGALIPNSLPLQGVLQPLNLSANNAYFSYMLAYDSLRKQDELVYLVNNSYADQEFKLMRAISHPGYARLDYFDDCNFQLTRYPGLRRVALLPIPYVYPGSDYSRDIYNLYFDSSITVVVHEWKPKDSIISRMVIGREDGHYLMPLALWQNPVLHHTLLVFAKRNRLRGKKTVNDTLCYLDLNEGKVIMQRPVGAKYVPTASLVQSDSLLILYAFDAKNGTAYENFSDDHSYLVAHRLDTSIAWADTLCKTTEERSIIIEVLPQRTVIMESSKDTTGKGGYTTITVRRSVICDTLLRRTVPIRLRYLLCATGDSNEGIQYYCSDYSNTLWKFDSTFAPVRNRHLAFTPGSVGGEAGVEYEISGIATGEHVVDVNGDSLGDFIMMANSGQFVVIDGATLDPLMATRPYQHIIQYGFVREGNGKAGIVVASGDGINRSLEIVDIVPTPLFDRIWVHRDRIIGVFLILVIVPLIMYFIWRVEYFHRLFQLLITQNKEQGVLIAALISSPESGAGNGSEKRSSVRIIDANTRFRTVFGIATKALLTMDMFPKEIEDMVMQTLLSGKEANIELTTTVNDADLYVMVSVRGLRLFRFFKRCVVTVADITESYERKVLETAIEIVHEAKRPLRTAQMAFQSLMKRIEGNLLGSAHSVVERRDTINANIVRCISTINRCIYLAEERMRSIDNAETLGLHFAVERWLNSIGVWYINNNFTIHNDIPQHLPQVVVYRRGLEHLLQCACDNALNATPDDRTIRAVTLSAENNGTSVQLRIADNGTGVDEKTIKKMLNGTGFSHGTHGSGLGMKIILKSCKEHNAILDITSVVGVGTTLYIAFPIAST